MPRVALLALAVGLVLADSSVVTLGLPGVLEDFDASPQDVSWVLIAYNLALALVAVPAALLARRAHGSPGLAVAGLVVFAVASLACALAPSLGVLVAARALQGIGGAAVACAALALLVAETGSRASGTALWGAAGALGAAVGPAAGGLLTEALSWEAIFAVQVPLAAACVLGVRRPVVATVTPASSSGAGSARPDVPHLAALFFLGAGLTAALFLLVLLLIAGWRESPVTAALTVSVMPLAALLAGRLGAGLDVRARGMAGALLVAGGLAALGLMPGASVLWTVVPQIFVGLGLGLSLAAMTEAALHGRDPLVLHGGWTIAARHAGVVLALALLTPLFTADLERQEDRAAESVLALLLDSELSPGTKVSLGLELAELLDGAAGEVPAVAPAFAAAQVSAPERPTVERLQDEVTDELDRAATTAFERSFVVAAVLSAAALLPLLAAGLRGPRRPEDGVAP